MGRLDDIIQRNKHPRNHRKLSVPVGVALSLLVLVVLVLMIFTDLGMPRHTERDRTTVHGVELRAVPAKDAARD